MTTTSRRPGRRPSTPAQDRPRSGQRQRQMWWVVAAVVAAAAVAAVVASRPHHNAAAGLQQTRPVTVEGAALAPLPDTGTPDPAVGEMIPTLQGAAFDGTPVTIGADGHPKVIAFVAHWCPHCQREVPLLVDWLAAHQLPAGAELFAVATSTKPDAPNYPPSAWLTRVHWPAPVLADDGDGSAARAAGLTAFPFFVAVNANGRVVARTSGELSTDAFAALASKAAGQ